MAIQPKISRAVIVQIALQMVEEGGAEPPSLRAIARAPETSPQRALQLLPDRADLNAAIAWPALARCWPR